MTHTKLLTAALAAGALVVAVVTGTPTETAAQGRYRTLQKKVVYKDRNPLSSPEEMHKRFKWPLEYLKGKDCQFELKNESYQLFVPKSYKKSKKDYGLLIWVAPSPPGWVPPTWEKALEKKKMLAIGANNSGNKRATPVRVALALDAAYNVMKNYRIDKKRVYISGFSGGGRISSFVAFHYPELIRGGIYVAGCDYHENVPIPGKNGAYWKALIPKPTAERLQKVKTQSRHVYIVGTKDIEHHQQMKSVAELAREQHGFHFVKYYEVKNMQHAVPLGRWFEKCVKFLDRPGKAYKPKAPTKSGQAKPEAKKPAGSGDKKS